MIEHFLSPTVWRGMSQRPIFFIFIIVFVALFTIGLASSPKPEATYFASVQCARYRTEDSVASTCSIDYLL